MGLLEKVVKYNPAEKVGSNEKYAIKSVWKCQFNDKDKLGYLKQEIDILSIIDHDNCIKCYHIYEDNLSIHFVFELVKGGDLLEHLMTVPGNKLQENQAQQFFAQILDALQYLHSINIIHRDIKPENFLISISETRGVRLKLIDFGFSARCEEAKKLKDIVGSTQYMAPEMIRVLQTGIGGYDNKVDIWAAGVTLFNMMTGRQPFLGNQDELAQNILTQEVNYMEEFKEDLQDLCCQLLKKDPDLRPSASMAKFNTWVTCSENQITVLKPFLPSTETIKHLNDFNMLSDLKHEVWTLALTYLSDTQINITKEILYQKIQLKDDTEGSLKIKDIITYDLLINAIMSIKDINPDLRIKLNGNYFFI